MDTTNGDAGRRDSINATQPIVFESPSCHRPAPDPADQAEQIVTANASVAVAVQEGPRLENRSTSYATFKDCKHVSACRKSPNRKSHHPRQPSSSDIKHPVSSFAKTPVVTDKDIDRHLCRMLEPNMDLHSAWTKAAALPPITHESLAELDISRIINNPKLRHDVNFDKELHFRPNLDGSRGRQKLKSAEDFWKALVAELTLYREIGAKLMACKTPHEMEYWYRMMRQSQKRLPLTFETIRDILKTLVPERDQASVGERIDVAMIMQEISRGLFDMMSLAQWLSTLLKAHCAPMRDEWIDQMAAQVQKGVETDSHKDLVLGLRQLLGILEAMKLDVANHQIRHLRAMLIEDGVNFQSRYHLARMQYGRLDVTRSRRWFEREYAFHLSQTPRPDKLRVFVAGLFKQLLTTTPLGALPDTFSLDSDRLRSMRNDLHGFINIDICIEVLDSILAKNVTPDNRAKAENALKTALPSIVGESRRFADAAGNIAVELVRVAMIAENSNHLDSARVEGVEHRLRVALQGTGTIFTTKAQAVLNSHLSALESLVRENLAVTPLTLHDRMFAPLPNAVADSSSAIVAKPVSPTQVKTVDTILLRICHVVVLHWHIWSPLVYDVAAEKSSTLSPESSMYDSDGSSIRGSDDECDTASEISEALSSTVNKP